MTSLAAANADSNGSTVFASWAWRIAVPLLCGRRTLLSVTLGTAAFVGLVNLL
jgi:branched-subunit amino acid transport protein AzlD